MSFETAYGTNGTTYPNTYHGYQNTMSNNMTSRDSLDHDKNKSDLQNTKKLVIQNLEEFSQGFVRLNEIAEYLGSSRDTKDFRARLKENTTRMSALSVSLKQSIDSLKNNIGGSSIEERRTQKELIKKFEDAFNKCNSLFRHKLEHIEQTISKYPPVSSQDSRIYEDEDDEETSLIKAQEQQFLLEQSEAEYQSMQIRDRENRIRELAKKSLEVNEMYKDISQLVSEQSEMIDTIEDRISITVENVNDGYQSTQKASEAQKKGRSKLCIIAIILTVIAAIAVIIVVIVTQVRKK